MDKLVRVILLIIGLSVAFIWVSNSFTACKSDEGQKEKLADYADNDAEELFEGGDVDYSTSDVDDEPIDEEIVDDEPEESIASPEVDFTSPPVKTKASGSAPAKQPSGTSDGDYMVIAGNYLVKSNADIMTQKLKDLGYSGAEIAVFDNSQYHTVIAGRYNSYQSASEVANAVKRQGIDCYVKKRQQ